MSMLSYFTVSSEEKLASEFQEVVDFNLTMMKIGTEYFVRLIDLLQTV